MSELIRGILFDIDGTLFDTPASMVAAAQATLAGFLPDVDAQAGARIWAADVQGRYTAYLAGELTFVEQRAQRVADLYLALGLPPPDAAGAARWLARYREEQLATTTVFDDVWSGLRGCDGYPMGAVSNNDGAWQRVRLARAGLTERIGPVVGIEDAGAAKPDPRIFHAGCAALGLDPAQVLYVGDDLALDARGAAMAGLRGVWLDRLGGGPAPAGVIRISSLGRLPELLARFGCRRAVR